MADCHCPVTNTLAGTFPTFISVLYNELITLVSQHVSIVPTVNIRIHLRSWPWGFTSGPLDCLLSSCVCWLLNYLPSGDQPSVTSFIHDMFCQSGSFATLKNIDSTQIGKLSARLFLFFILMIMLLCASTTTVGFSCHIVLLLEYLHWTSFPSKPL